MQGHFFNGEVDLIELEILGRDDELLLVIQLREQLDGVAQFGEVSFDLLHIQRLAGHIELDGHPHLVEEVEMKPERTSDRGPNNVLEGVVHVVSLQIKAQTVREEGLFGVHVERHQGPVCLDDVLSVVLDEGQFSVVETPVHFGALAIDPV